MESAPLPASMPDGRAWPRLSIVTPSYNQAEFLEETLRSVLLQGYPDLEYVVMDGGSTDGSVAILERYAPWLTSWESRPDSGQANALNRGLARCTGQIAAWVNSDDLYLEEVFGRVAHLWAERRDRPFWLAAAVAFFGEDRTRAKIVHQPVLDDAAALAPISTSLHAAGVFWDRSLLNLSGSFREDLHYSFDKEYWLRLLVAGNACRIDNSLVAAAYRFHEHSKSVSARLAFHYESSRVALEHAAAAGLNREVVRSLRDTLVYSAARLAQDSQLPPQRRRDVLFQSARRVPAALLRRDWLGGLVSLLRTSR